MAVTAAAWVAAEAEVMAMVAAGTALAAEGTVKAGSMAAVGMVVWAVLTEKRRNLAHAVAAKAGVAWARAAERVAATLARGARVWAGAMGPKEEVVPVLTAASRVGVVRAVTGAAATAGGARGTAAAREVEGRRRPPAFGLC